MTPLRAPTMRPSFGETIEGLSVDGQRIRAAVFDENAVRAAAGSDDGARARWRSPTPYFAKVYVPIRVRHRAVLFPSSRCGFVGGLRLQPARPAARARSSAAASPQWVSAKPKRFAWTLGLVMCAGDGGHHQRRDSRPAAAHDLPAVPGADVARGRARAVPGLRDLPPSRGQGLGGEKDEAFEALRRRRLRDGARP